jgi:hypothetical protein
MVVVVVLVGARLLLVVVLVVRTTVVVTVVRRRMMRELSVMMTGLGVLGGMTRWRRRRHMDVVVVVRP